MTFFETEHLIVRRFEDADAEQLYNNHLGDKVKEWFPNECYEDAAEAGVAIKFYADCVNSNQLPFVLAVELKETGEMIGDTGVNEVEGHPGEVEVGYIIADTHSGKGYATELVKAMTQFSFDRFDVSTIYGRVVHGNDASVRVLEKGGITFVTEEFEAEDDPYGKGMLVYKKDAPANKESKRKRF